ncbi:MAG TPA: chromate resistance protein ChrB domain-containing protein [Bacillota bacterium]|nr:chromate resistance protein ChrB domain-containing protein [Bacillota bacterium]
MKSKVLLILIITVLFTSGRALSATTHQYVFWKGLEADKCGVAWLIKRFVDKEAVFVFVDKGTPILSGIPMDTPDSKIQRKLNLTAYEVALTEYKLTHPALKQIGKIIWDIEINKWDKKVTRESPGIALIINGLDAKESNPGKALEQSMIIYDSLFVGLGGTF